MPGAVRRPYTQSADKAVERMQSCRVYGDEIPLITTQEYQEKQLNIIEKSLNDVFMKYNRKLERA